jgi:Uma2 family endonuclease
MPLKQPETGRFYTRDEYRTWSAAQPTGRYERVDGRVVAMAPERGAHLR